MNYREKFQNEYGFELPSSWHVHHIDGDRSNDSLENLAALPKNVHQAYHTVTSKCQFGVLNFEEAVFKGYVTHDHINRMADILKCIKMCKSIHRNIHSFQAMGKDYKWIFNDIEQDCNEILS